ncbi:sterol 14-demethylase [Nicotiana attenuata]|uniref:Sterol 14-demethylase n=1 Tax=Nicotiana attenuata TaxID=49451 RepID=A0A314L662_NICAT|nr:sterol 14-demethylase [Nicotiana attenuata]
MELGDNKILNVGLLLVATLVVAKLKSALIMPKSNKRLPPVIESWPILGGLLRFLKGPMVMLREEYPMLGSVFTSKQLDPIQFLLQLRH